MKRDFRSWLKDKHVAVVGLGVSGEGVLNTLQNLGVKAYVFDKRIPDSLSYGEYVPTDGEGFNRELQIDLAVISPGIPLSSEQAQYFIKRGIPLMGEIEFAYCLTDREFICITGTNGKTTTTSLCGEIFKRHTDAKVVGNIGIAAAPCTLEPYDLFVAEISSFQIETLNNFRAKICAVLNITPDHLDRHGSFEVYTALKLDMLRRGELKVVNADCPVLAAHVIEHASDGEYPDLYLFSAQKRVEKGAFVEDGKIYVSGLHQGGNVSEIEVSQQEWICDLSDIRLMGAHNVENVLAAVLIARLYGVAQKVIRESIIHFRAVEHRIEFVRTLDDVRFY
ncbi:MAG: UDP-N-acetylmuramoyl-L-alanine--D-glutamate ligase, partial [Bacillota bacterium]|nr:UDP-N-acetylmuramoyl-L-alanine--D-glutamate ligase [Bacillota bacterium]